MSVLTALLLACAPTPAPTPEVEQVSVELPTTWPVEHSRLEALGPYSGRGWVALIGKGDIRAAAESGGPVTARAHAEAAGLFRMASLVAAHAVVQTYGERAQPTDPIEAKHLLTVSYAILGDLPAARSAAAELPETHAALAWHAPWRTWLAGEAAWPPELSELPLTLPPVQQGTWPVLDTSPHYVMPVGEFTQPMGDPAALLRLAWWHEEAARSSASDDVTRFLARYELPAEDLYVEGKLGPGFLYGSAFLGASDAGFLDAVAHEGPSVVAGWAERSVMAGLVDDAREDGKVSAVLAVDLARAVRADVLEGSQEANGDELLTHHRMFADLAQVAVLRGMADVAEAEGDRETSGKLRIAAYDIDFDHTRSAPASMSLAAWQAANGYAYRAQDVIQRQSSRTPSLEVARYAVDVLALRRGNRR